METLAEQGLGLAAVSNDAQDIIRRFADRKGITYPILADSGSVVIRRYGILNEQIARDAEWFGIPHPGTFILDSEGRVTARYFEEAYQTRMTGRGLALHLDAGAVTRPDSALTLAAEHLEVAVHLSDPVVAPGQEFFVALDVSVPEGVHIYAPGDHSYRVLRLVLEPDTNFVAGEPLYPESTIYHFKPLDERVPVFAGAFRLLQPVVLVASRGLSARAKEPGATLTLKARLEYQACDDTVCYVPESIPVRLTVGLRPLEN